MNTEEETHVSASIRQFPHCDPRVLHAPGVCNYCDEQPKWQALRIVWNINFTGGTDPKKAPCPAETFRPVEVINAWHGNRPNGE